MKSDMHFEMTEWLENEKISFRKVSGGGPDVYLQEWKSESENSGSTFIFKEEIVMPWGFIGRLLESVAKGSSQATVEKMLAKLKGMVEGEEMST
jgi:hypothetical protein